MTGNPELALPDQVDEKRPTRRAVRSCAATLEAAAGWANTAGRKPLFSAPPVVQHDCGDPLPDCPREPWLAAGTINGRLATVRRLACEAADSGLPSPERAAGIRRVKRVKEIWREAWKPAHGRGGSPVPAGRTLKGKRDRAFLAVLLGRGLRRRELADLDFTHLHQREEHWAVVDPAGKGGHIRTVAVPAWVEATVTAWVGATELKTGRTIPLRLPSRKALG